MIDHTFEYMRDRIDWARETLIPDLRESGSDATADDVAMFCEMVEQLLPKPLEEGRRRVILEFDVEPISAKPGGVGLAILGGVGRSVLDALVNEDKSAADVHWVCRDSDYKVLI